MYPLYNGFSLLHSRSVIIFPHFSTLSVIHRFHFALIMSIRQRPLYAPTWRYLVPTHPSSRHRPSSAYSLRLAPPLCGGPLYMYVQE